MRQHMVTAVATVAVLLFLAGSAPGQDISATIRTYQGVSYKVADPSLEVFYSIGEPKEKTEGSKFPSMISITPGSTGAGGGGEAAGEAASEAIVLRGHSRANDITLSSQGVETRIAWEQVQAMRFARKPVTVQGLPPYIPCFRYSVSLNLVTGVKVEADYVNLGATIVRGTAPNGRVDIPWEEIEYIIFDR